MKVVIIEDEKPAARRLNRMVEYLGIIVLKILHSVEESIEWFQENESPDLIFLDVQLSDGLSFEIFEEVSISSAIIFTTAYDEYALKAFKLNSIDYLLKPIDDEDLEHAIKQYEKQYSKKKPTLNIKDIQDLISSEKGNYKKRFTIKVGQHIKMISLADIECIYSENKGTYISTLNSRSYLLEDSLEQLSSKLDPSLFFRVSRKFYINIHSIKDIVSYTNSRLQIYLHYYTEKDIIVSRERVKDFKAWIDA